MLDESGRCIAVGITGASGALYAVRTIAALLSKGCRVELVASSFTRVITHARVVLEWSMETI